MCMYDGYNINMTREEIVKETKTQAEKLIEKHVDKDFDEKHTWTIFLLVDIKVIYIISYAYISIVNLISSTANIEATDDKHTDVEFQITATQSGFVTNISDPVLWNCRPHSASDYYYKFLYWMLFIGLISALSGFFLSKLITLINLGILSPESGLTRLWHIAVFQSHPKEDKSNLECILDDASTKALKKIPVKVFDQVKGSCGNIWRTVIPFIVLFILVSGMFIAYFSYDIHPLACIRGQDDTTIQYHKEGTKMGRVEINLSDDLITFQIAAGITTVVLALVILLFASCFFFCSYHVVQKMKKLIKNDEEIQDIIL